MESTETSAPHPDRFVHCCSRLPRGHDVALAHAELVLLGRTLSQFDARYDEVFLATEQVSIAEAKKHLSTTSPTPSVYGPQSQQALEDTESTMRPRRRRGAFRLDPKVLEAKLSKRYEIFQLPEAVKVLFHRPQQEKDWTSLAALAKYVVDAANGVLTVKIAGANAAEELRGAVLLGEQRSDLGFQEQLVIGSHVFHPGDRLLTPLSSLTAPTTEVRIQRAGWTRCPLSDFGE